MQIMLKNVSIIRAHCSPTVYDCSPTVYEICVDDLGHMSDILKPHLCRLEWPSRPFMRELDLRYDRNLDTWTLHRWPVSKMI